MEDALHIILQVVCTLFQRNGAKLLAYGDSLRTGVEKGLLQKTQLKYRRSERLAS